MARLVVIVLAAGRSTRFAAGERSKLVALVGSVPVVRRAVDAAVAAAVGDVVVVTGANATEVEQAVDSLPVRVVHAARSAEGMAHSLRCGVEAAGDVDAVLVSLGDQPGVRPESYRRIVERWRETDALVVVPRYAGNATPAHPVLFASSIYPELLQLDGDVGARSVIMRDPARIAEVLLDWPAPRDVDTLDDLEALTQDARERAEPRASTPASPANG